MKPELTLVPALSLPEAPDGLTKLEHATRLLAEVRTIDDAKHLADRAAAAEVWAKRARLGLEAQNYAAEIKIRAERKAGKLLNELERTPGIRTDLTLSSVGQGSDASPYARAIKEAKATRQEAHRWQKVASVPDKAFETVIAATKSAGKALTTGVIIGSKSNPPSIQDRRTPQWLFDTLTKRFGPFKLDAFADGINHLCDEYYTREDNAYVQPWADVTFANPEFEDMGPPIDTALKQAALRGVRTIMLGLVGCSQEWYHELAIQGTIYVPDKRISYDLPDGSATTSNANRDTIIMAFGGEHENKKWKHGEFRVRALPLSLPDRVK